MIHKEYGEMSELAEGARLEIVCAVNSGTEGSNPSLSAIKAFVCILQVVIR
jgi:hypothetical protein